MNTPLIHIRRHRATQAAKSMLNYPLKYFANTNNIKRLESIVEDDERALKVINILKQQQTQFSSYLNFSQASTSEHNLIKNLIENQSEQYVNIKSELCPDAPSELFELGVTNIVSRMNLNLAESLNGIGVRSDLSDNNVFIAELLNSAWLVDHFAMYLVGAVDLSEDVSGNFIFKPKHEDQFTPLWFGNALEQSSLQAGNYAIAKLAASSYAPNANDLSLQMLHARVLSLVEQHWKLKSSTIFEKVFHQKADLIMLLLGAYQNHLSQDSFTAITRGKIETLVRHSPNHHGLLNTYDVVKAFQQALPSEDRLFDIMNDGLVLGNTEIVRGLIKQVEHFAAIQFGNDWHANLEKEQLAELFGSLKEHAHIDVLNFGLKQEHIGLRTQNEIGLDIDFFIRDNRTKKVYAVQLKHIESNFKANLALWLDILAGANAKLGKGVTQLENLGALCKTDQKIRDRLIQHGIIESEIPHIVPILVHNCGSMDMIKLHSNIWLYDISTFVRVLTGRTAILDVYDGENYRAEGSSKFDASGLRLDEPLEIVHAYLQDERFQKLKHFDAGRHISRTARIEDTTFSSIGLAL
ncbi:hypothetical protein GCM10007938_15150 [Vibrio zhanjiangensis]|uniref:Uncharacterized protein n=1 Tax=Vibrio zhanjiangensis TaxID=1046128 RepID=A0ABQ6EX13_9VIBR|nr:hypothetical protein [Vibrio zhanjiangensis]GLT17737.1 hypothetical protein GCM10007938_15150 [Vibrio zhanjiangensis]